MAVFKIIQRITKDVLFVKKLLLCSLGILLPLFVAVGAQAELFTQGPGSDLVSYTSNGNDPDYGFSRTADDFTLSSPSTITSVKWWGVGEGGARSAESFTFTFYDDQSGFPGSSSLLSGKSLVATDLGKGLWVYESVLTSPFSVAGGKTYWLSIYDTRANSIWGWMKSDLNRGTYDYALQKFGEGEWDKVTNAAFELTGSQVPIPPAAWLLGSGLIALIAIRRRRRTR